MKEVTQSWQSTLMVVTAIVALAVFVILPIIAIVGFCIMYLWNNLEMVGVVLPTFKYTIENAIIVGLLVAFLRLNSSSKANQEEHKNDKSAST